MHFKFIIIAVTALALSFTIMTVTNAGQDKDKRRDHEVAAEALKRGEVLSLTEILSIVQNQVEGEIVEIEFERKHDQWIYKIKYITPRNKLIKIKLDAETGEILKTKEY